MMANYCEKHKHEYIYLSTSHYEPFAFKCKDCIIDQKLKGENLISIEQIKNSNQNSIFTNYPINDQSIQAPQIVQVFDKSQTNIADKKTLEDLFKKRNELIQNLQNQILQLYDNEIETGEDIIKKVQKFSQCDKIRQIILDEKKLIKNKSTELKHIFTNFNDGQFKNIEPFQGQIDQLSKIEKEKFDMIQKLQKDIQAWLKQLTQISSKLSQDSGSINLGEDHFQETNLTKINGIIDNNCAQDNIQKKEQMNQIEPSQFDHAQKISQNMELIEQSNEKELKGRNINSFHNNSNDCLILNQDSDQNKSGDSQASIKIESNIQNIPEK